MKYTIGFSPCPNDTFIFDALINHHINTGSFQFEPVLADVQTLNEWAIEGKLAISKISYGVLPLATKHYKVLESGGALGKGVGPLLVTNPNQSIDEDSIHQMKIAIPGKDTTAHLLFSLAYPKVRNKQFMVFHEIEEAILSRKVDAGVIIHENRFTYQQRGLKKITDLGEYWQAQTHSPIPLGGIIALRSIPDQDLKQINLLIQQSLQWSLNNNPHISNYVQQHAQTMQPDVMRQHIDLYVNEYSIQLGSEGRKAVQTLMEVYEKITNTHPSTQSDLFI